MSLSGAAPAPRGRVTPLHMLARDRQSFILGMEFAMRIVRNSAETSFNGAKPDETMLEGINSMIRLVQVEVGSGRMPVPNVWSTDEIDEVGRIS